MYLTHPPCPHCAGTLVQAGIVEVHAYKPTKEFLDRWPLDDTKRVLKLGGIGLYLHKRN